MSKEVEVIRGKMKQSFTLEEKRRIVFESLASPLSLTQYAKSIGISAPTLCIWRKQFKNDCNKQSWENDQQDLTTTTKPMHFEQVLKENHTLKAENQILKEQMFKLKAFVGHKMFELEAPKYM